MPGALEDEQYQRIAIYLADRNGVAGLNEGEDWAEIAVRLPTSRTTRVQPVVLNTPTARPQWFLVYLIAGGVMALVIGGIAWANRRISDKRSSSCQE